jgi:hypothetical protein
VAPVCAFENLKKRKSVNKLIRPPIYPSVGAIERGEVSGGFSGSNNAFDKPRDPLQVHEEWTGAAACE